MSYLKHFAFLTVSMLALNSMAVRTWHFCAGADLKNTRSEVVNKYYFESECQQALSQIGH